MSLAGVAMEEASLVSILKGDKDSMTRFKTKSKEFL